MGINADIAPLTVMMDLPGMFLMLQCILFSVSIETSCDSSTAHKIISAVDFTSYDQLQVFRNK
jgi:hypothetical protein